MVTYNSWLDTLGFQIFLEYKKTVGSISETDVRHLIQNIWTYRLISTSFSRVYKNIGRDCLLYCKKDMVKDKHELLLKNYKYTFRFLLQIKFFELSKKYSAMHHPTDLYSPDNGD